MPPPNRKRKPSTTAQQRQPATKRAKAKAHKEAPTSTTSAANDKPSYLEELPDEVLLLTLEYVPLQDRKTYYNLSLTSRRLNGVANEFLYSKFQSFSAPPLKFLRTIIANPELAARVKILTWDFVSPTGRRGSVPKPSSGDSRLLRESLKRLDVPAADRAGWTRLYSRGDWSSLLEVSYFSLSDFGHNSYFPPEI